MIDRGIVLVGLMGAGKTAIGRRLATQLGLPFRDADAEIELAAGRSIAEIFARYGEASFRDGERRVIRRLLSGPPLVLATGGGAFMDAETRAAIRAAATSLWLRCPLSVLVRRVSSRTHRPLLHGQDPAEVLLRLAAQRHPVYAEADIVVDCGDEHPEQTTTRVQDALLGWRRPRRLPVALSGGSYDIVVGDGLLGRAGAYAAPVMAQRRAVVVTDEAVAPLHLPALLAGLAEAGIETHCITVAAGEASKDVATWARRGGRPAGLRGRAADHGDRAGRRRGRRPRRVRRRGDPARPALRAGADDAAGAGGQLCWAARPASTRRMART